jgi:hypothetical protein
VCTETGAQGPAENEETWTDYRPAGTVLLPMRQTTVSGGIKVSESAMSNVEIDFRLDPGLFVKP